MCESSIALTVLLYVKVALNIIHIVVPIGMIIMVALDLLKQVASQEVKLNEGLKLMTNRLLAGCIVFLIPYLLAFVFNLMGVAAGSQSLYDQCYNTVDKDMISYYEQLEDQEYKETLERLGIKDYEASSNNLKYNITGSQSSNSSYTGTQNGTFTSEKKENKGVTLDTGNATIVSNMTEQQLVSAITNYQSNKKLSLYAKDYIAAEKKYSVNALVLVAIDAYESGWGNTANCNNMGGVIHYKGTKDPSCNGWQKYSSLNEYLDDHARLLAQSYLSPSGAFYEGTSIAAIGKHYCVPPDTWITQVTLIAKGLLNKI